MTSLKILNTDSIKTTILGGSGNNGESCIIEDDDGSTGIIDCFTDRIQGIPVPQSYIESRGIKKSDVKFIVISHLHGDHCDGIVDLIKEYPDSALYISEINLLESFRNIIKFQHPNLKFSGWTKGQKLYKYLSENPRKKIQGLKEGDSINFTPSTRLNILYPSEECINFFDESYKNQLDDLTKRVSKIETNEDLNPSQIIKINLAKNFNEHSVVIEALGKAYNSIYLADLEFQKEMGLEYVLKKASQKGNKYNIFKVPHHGSKTSFNKNLWESVLASPLNDQFLKLSCWKKGQKHLPEKNIVDDMLLITQNIFCTGIPEMKTPKIKNSTKKFYENINLKFKTSTHKYGSVSLIQNISSNKLEIDIRSPAVHVSELFID